MSVLERLSCAQGRRDEEPNRVLARDLVERRDAASIDEIVQNLRNRDRRIQSDCVSVLEHVGHLAPELIEDYVSEFLDLLCSKNNRLVWGGMIALSLVAERGPAEIIDRLETVIETIQGGSVITRDAGIKTLAIICSSGRAYGERVFSFLSAHLETCRPKSVPQHAEHILRAVTPGNREQFIDVLNQRLESLSPSQQRRVAKVLRAVEQGG
jgi:hypothetical protein